MESEKGIRDLLARSLGWGEAHVTYEQAVRGVPTAFRAKQLPGFPHSLWQLVEHLRITQADLLAFCLPGEYRELQWPREYWPESAAPPHDDAWDESVAAYQSDLETLEAIASDPSLDMASVVPHGTEQTYARELLLVLDHTAYHIGQIVALRQVLGIWPPAEATE
jgi:uncharacterized damage-inducible protein DinB